MTVYLLTIALTAILGAAGSQSRYVRVNLNGQEEYSWNSIYSVLILIVWCSVFAFRAITVGTDAPGYYRTFTSIVDNNLSYSQFTAYQRDWLFNYLEFFSAKLSHGNWFFFQFVVALLIYAPVIHVARKYSSDVTSSLLLYIFILRFFSGYNGMRQAIAASVVIYAYYDFLLEKKYKKFILLMICAFGFHSSVLLAVPFILISTLDLRNRIVRWSSLSLIVLYVFVWQIWPFIIRFFEMIGQAKMAADYAEVAVDNGSGLLRFIVAMLPFLLGYLCRNVLYDEYDRVDNELILSLFAGLFMLLSMRYWIFARVSDFFAIGQVMLLPKLKSALSPKWLSGGIILCLYLAYMVAMLLHGEGHYYPYIFFNSY